MSNTVTTGTGTPGECRFPNGEPKGPNEALRCRIHELTIYDSQDDHGIWLERGSTTVIRPSTGAGVIFLVVVMLLTAATILGVLL